MRLLTKDAKKRQAKYLPRNKDNYQLYTAAQVADAKRDAVADYARKLMSAINRSKSNDEAMRKVIDKIEEALRDDTAYDDENDDDFWK